MKLWNLTLHEQGPREVDLAAREGFDLDPRPRGVFVPLGGGEFEAARSKVAEALRACREAGAAALLGGHTAVWLAGALDLVWAGEGLPDLVFFETDRRRGVDGQFCFHPVGLRRIAGGWVGE